MSESSWSSSSSVEMDGKLWLREFDVTARKSVVGLLNVMKESLVLDLICSSFFIMTVGEHRMWIDEFELLMKTM